MSMNLKPYRDYSEHFVLNGLFSLNTATGSKGTLLQVVNFVQGGAKVNWDVSANMAAGIKGVYSHRPVLPNRVQAAPSGAGSTVIGMQLYDVLDSNPTTQALLIYGDQVRRAELQCVLSGEAVPIVTKGTFEVQGFEGTPGPGSGIGISNSGNGVMSVIAANTPGNYGKFLTPSGKDGSAIIILDVK